MTKPKLSLSISFLLILITFLLTLGFALTANAADTYQNTSNNNQNSNNSYFRYKAAISGDQEIPAINSGVSGYMSIDFYASGDGILYWVSGVGMGVTEVHLHCAGSGANGPVVAVLHRNPNGQNFNEQQMAGGTIINGGLAPTGAECVNTIGYGIANVTDLSRAIREGKIYVNIHNLQYPNGAARGQLAPANSNNSSVYYPTNPQPNYGNNNPSSVYFPNSGTGVYFPNNSTGVYFPNNNNVSSVYFPPPNTPSGTYVGVTFPGNNQQPNPPPTPPVVYNPPPNQPYYPNYCVQGQNQAYLDSGTTNNSERKNFFSRMFSFKG